MRMCGDSTPADFVSPLQMATLQFSSDSIETRRGIAATVTFVDPGPQGKRLTIIDFIVCDIQHQARERYLLWHQEYKIISCLRLYFGPASELEVAG